MIEPIVIAAIALHFVGGISFAIGLLICSVVFRKYWIKLPQKKFLFFKIPRLGNALQINAMALIFLSFIFFAVGILGIPEIQGPKFAGYFVLILSSIFACYSMVSFYKSSSRKVKTK